jgi:protein disulfide-isomerase-like protein
MVISQRLSSSTPRVSACLRVVYWVVVCFLTSVACADASLLFFVVGCGHCKRLAPTWEELAGAVEDSAVIATVDCTKSNALCGQHEVKGYPTLKFFQPGQATGAKYAGGRDLAALTEYVSRCSVTHARLASCLPSCCGLTSLTRPFSFTLMIVLLAPQLREGQLAEVGVSCLLFVVEGRCDHLITRPKTKRYLSLRHYTHTYSKVGRQAWRCT